MAGKVLNKMMGILGLEEDYDDMDELEDYGYEYDDNENLDPISKASKKEGKVVNIHTAASAKVILVKPHDYEEVTTICDNLKNRKIVIVNTTSLEPKIAQRFLDFMGGASYALLGDLSEIEKGIYILSPSNVEVTNELKSELSSKSVMFNWSNK